MTQNTFEENSPVVVIVNFGRPSESGLLDDWDMLNWWCNNPKAGPIYQDSQMKMRLQRLLAAVCPHLDKP